MQAKTTHIDGREMTVLQVKFDLSKAGFSQVDIARNLGVGRAIVCKVVGGRERSLKIEEAIIGIIGWDPFPPANKRMTRRDANGTANTQ